MKTKLIIFDFDGVLINSLPNMMVSWKCVQKRFNLDNDFNEYQKYIGLDFEEILFKMNIKKNIKKIKDYYSYSSMKNINIIKLYPGVNKLLLNLQKKTKLAILTSKDKSRTKLMLKKLLPKIKFASVQSPQKNYRPKPYSDLMLKVISENNVDPKDVIYVGDTIFDIKMANSSNIKFVYASYGYSNIKKHNGFKNISSFNQLNKIII